MEKEDFGGIVSFRNPSERDIHSVGRHTGGETHN